MARPRKLYRVCDSEPGIRRVRRDESFVYLDAGGSEVTDSEILARIHSLAIPPAYTDVWICPHPRGHIQATGRDARGRKQYRYHPDWRCQRDETKFERMVAFGRALPAIRAQVARDIRLPGLPRAKILAAIIRLLEITLIRVGNDDYARTNQSYGLTTLRNRHCVIEGAAIHFDFRGKSGIRHKIKVRDRTLASIVQRVRELPGHELFQYLDPAGKIRDVASEDVNRYLRGCAGEGFTAKDFRTWAATALSFELLCQAGAAPSEIQARKRVNRVLEDVAGRLGNTPSVCRKSYVHPGLIDAYMEGNLANCPGDDGGEEVGRGTPGLRGSEARLLAFLEESCL